MHICIEKSWWDDIAPWYIIKCLCYMPELEVVWLGNFWATDISRTNLLSLSDSLENNHFFRALCKTVTWFIRITSSSYAMFDCPNVRVWVRTCTQICTNCILYCIAILLFFYRLHNIIKSIDRLSTDSFTWQWFISFFQHYI
jgi:hypothetical protein